MRKAIVGRRGVQYDKDHFLTELMVADNSAIFADSDGEATDILYEISHFAQSYGLKINADKRKVLATDGLQDTVHLDGTQIEQVLEFKYQGSLD